MSRSLPLRSADAPLLHSTHWGMFEVRKAGTGIRISPPADDPSPSPLLGNIETALDHAARVRAPMIRRGWLENGPGHGRGRGREPFVQVPWEVALDLVAREIGRVRALHGNAGIYGGSYGWASAGRFHHALGQLHRFLNCAGGYVGSVNTYSAGAALVILPHVLGPYADFGRNDLSWPDVAAHSQAVLAFGGMAPRNGDVSSGGISRHEILGHLRAMKARGCGFILVSPVRGDLPGEIDAEWIPIRPGTDVALMLGLAHRVISRGRHDREFLARFTVGFDRFEDYVLGRSDGTAKDAGWAAGITGIARERIASLADEIFGPRLLVTLSQSLQRAEHGEQPVWMGIALAALTGQLGLPGGGFAYGLGSIGNAGKPVATVSLPTLPQGRNPVGDFIPVARVADMLLHPGETFDYDGRRLRYPDIRLVYWAGGNPFHHHQDLNRLRQAFARPDTIVVHEQAWTATARHADIVLPATMSLERNDIGASASDPQMIAMPRAVPPVGEARNDHDIFAGLAARLGIAGVFTEGLDEEGWLRRLYETTRTALAAAGADAPDFDAFWREGRLSLPLRPGTGGRIGAFRRDPTAAPLPTPSGRVELYSEVIAGFGYRDCPGHPVWIEPEDDGTTDGGSTAYPLHLIASQPATRLHSQLDFGATSQNAKVQGREPIVMNRRDAGARGIRDGMVVRVFNDRGAFLAGARLSDGIVAGAAQIATGAWYDPADPASDRPDCVHGNPNTVTRDRGTSSLAQGCTGQLTRVEIVPWTGPLPPVRAFDPPQDAGRGGSGR